MAPTRREGRPARHAGVTIGWRLASGLASYNGRPKAPRRVVAGRCLTVGASSGNLEVLAEPKRCSDLDHVAMGHDEEA